MIKSVVCGLVIGLLGPGFAVGAGQPEGDVYSSHLMVDQEVTVSARITGVIEKINVDRGTAVKKGQSLATLELQEFEQGVREAREDMQLAKVELERAQALSAGSIMSKAELDEKKARYAVASAAWEKARAIRDYAFSVLNVPRLICLIHHDNVASQNVAAKIGMTFGREGEDEKGPYLMYAMSKP